MSVQVFPIFTLVLNLSNLFTKLFGLTLHFHLQIEMARTKSTTRKSTGGRVPVRRLAPISAPRQEDPREDHEVDQQQKELQEVPQDEPMEEPQQEDQQEEEDEEA